MGFDGGATPDGRTHFYSVPTDDPVDFPPPYARARGTCWPRIAERAREGGVRIVNCSPLTMLECFEQRELAEMLLLA